MATDTDIREALRHVLGVRHRRDALGIDRLHLLN